MPQQRGASGEHCVCCEQLANAHLIYRTNFPSLSPITVFNNPPTCVFYASPTQKMMWHIFIFVFFFFFLLLLHLFLPVRWFLVWGHTVESISRGFAESQVQLLKDGVINFFRLIENSHLEGAVKCLLAETAFSQKTALMKSFFNVYRAPDTSRLPQNFEERIVISFSLFVFSSLLNYPQSDTTSCALLCCFSSHSRKSGNVGGRKEYQT